MSVIPKGYCLQELIIATKSNRVPLILKRSRLVWVSLAIAWLLAGLLVPGKRHSHEDGDHAHSHAHPHPHGHAHPHSHRHFPVRKESDSVGSVAHTHFYFFGFEITVPEFGRAASKVPKVIVASSPGKVRTVRSRSESRYPSITLPSGLDSEWLRFHLGLSCRYTTDFDWDCRALHASCFLEPFSYEDSPPVPPPRCGCAPTSMDLAA
jgi:hypothetical protein